MSPCFADTSYFIALLSPGDANHSRAHEVAATFRRPVVTSEYIVLEIGNFFRAPASRSRFGSFFRVLNSDPGTTIIPATSALLRAAAELFVSREDKSWSLTDCTSFVIMREQHLSEALTADRHFEQAGFRALLREH